MLALTLFAALVTAQAEDAPYDLAIEKMSRGELQAEYARLEEQRPGIAGPITMMSVGGGLLGYGVFLLLATPGPGGLGSSFTDRNPIGYLFVGMMMLGVALLTPGIWLAWTRRAERAECSERMDEINERLQAIERADKAEERRTGPRRREAFVPQL